jgi:hypothetical protein
MGRSTHLSYEEYFGRPIFTTDLDDDFAADMLSAQTFIPLDITALREIATNAVQNLAAHGGILASDSTPILERVNGATDRQLRVRWAAEDVAEVAFPPIPIPPDLDSAETVDVHLLLQRSGSTDDCDIDVLAFFNGIGSYSADTEMGGKTDALTTTNVEEQVVSLAAANISGHPGFLGISLLPDAHDTDAIYLLAAWLEYTRKLRTT